MLAVKHSEWVLQTIDRLRQRKARPDLERITRMVERFHGLTYSETKESLDKLVEKGIIVKVHFKGNISYRRHSGSGRLSELSDTNATRYRVIHAIKTIMKQTGDGVTFTDLENWLIAKNPETKLVKQRLFNALEREINACTVTKLPDECFVLTESLPDSPKSKPESSNPKPSLKETSNEKSTCSLKKQETVQRTQQETESNNSVERNIVEPAKRGRPLSKRKKFKKTHGPDFESTIPLKKSGSKDEMRDDETECAFCSVASKKAKDGENEPLLTCKECNINAHPSCLNYSEKLARRALDSPWQCMECKTCYVCDGSDNAALLLFCDSCDKGYHMPCHNPPLSKEPKGKWVCSLCKNDRGKDPDTNKSSCKKEKAADINCDDEDPEERKTHRRGRKRKLSKQNSVVDVKRKSSAPSVSSLENTSPTEECRLTDFTDGTAGASCLPTPSASPRHGDTFEYEMKMSLAGVNFPVSDDNTPYSDATDWDIDEVVRFFQNCGFEDHSCVFKDQEIDGRSLLLMQRTDVLTGLGLKLGPALKIYQKIVKLQCYSRAVS